MNYVATVLIRSNQHPKNIKRAFESQGARLPQPHFAINCLHECRGGQACLSRHLSSLDGDDRGQGCSINNYLQERRDSQLLVIAQAHCAAAHLYRNASISVQDSPCFSS